MWTGTSWLAPPVPLDMGGKFRACPEEGRNVAFRFGVAQSDKLRRCDDLRGSLAKTAFAIRTPINLPGWGYIASAASILAANRCGWSFGKVGHRASHNAFPVQKEDSRYAVIAPRRPSARQRYGFRPKNQLFGPTDAVLHYNCLSHIIDPLLRRLLLIQTVGYFDDF